MNMLRKIVDSAVKTASIRGYNALAINNISTPFHCRLRFLEADASLLVHAVCAGGNWSFWSTASDL